MIANRIQNAIAIVDIGLGQFSRSIIAHHNHLQRKKQNIDQYRPDTMKEPLKGLISQGIEFEHFGAVIDHFSRIQPLRAPPE